MNRNLQKSPKTMKDTLQFLKGHLAQGALQNYVIPGLQSHLIGGGDRGRVRLFESQRDQQESITPHSHRFDLRCLVLTGVVTNKIWTPACDLDNSDEFFVGNLRYEGEPGKYAEPEPVGRDHYQAVATDYWAGEWYEMRHDEIHSIRFGRGTAVLFFEGAQVTDTTTVLEPCVDSLRIPTLETKPWMFRPVGVHKNG
jgi:hypothetical protein